MKQDFFGKPFKELIEFFEGCERGSIADLGARQNKNSIPLFKLGFDVTAVDISSSSLRQINEKQKDIKTIKADICGFDVSRFDYILMDSMLHFNENCFERERTILRDIMNAMKIGAIFVNCMKESAFAEEKLAEIAKEYGFEMIEDRHLWYSEGNCEYHMLAVKKI
jgi:SAM-dependent methyltransferase